MSSHVDRAGQWPRRMLRALTARPLGSRAPVLLRVAPVMPEHLPVAPLLRPFSTSVALPVKQRKGGINKATRRVLKKKRKKQRGTDRSGISMRR